MQILEKNLSIQEYSRERLRKNLLGISQDTKIILLDSDISYIIKQVEEVLSVLSAEGRLVSCYEIRYTTYRILLSSGYASIAKYYLDFNI